MKTVFEMGDIVTLEKTELNKPQFIGVEFVFVSYLQQPFATSENIKVMLDCVVYHRKNKTIMFGKSQNMKLVEE